MNHRNRHLQYRKNLYRKKRIGVTLTVSLVVIAIVFALFIILGNLLHSKTSTPTETGKSTEPKETQATLPPAVNVNAHALPLLEDGTIFANRLATISTDANAVCINLNTADGALLFRSTLASELSQLKVHTDASALSSSLASIDRSGFYTTGVLYVPSFDQSNDLLRDVELATWGAVACEAIRDGVGDILIIAPSMSATDVKKICDLADNIHDSINNASIGFALSDNILSEENSANLIKELSLHFNYLSLDTTVYRADEEPEEFIKNRVSALLLEIMFYKMRILLPRTPDTELQKKYIEAVQSYNVTSWQILP